MRLVSNVQHHSDGHAQPNVRQFRVWSIESFATDLPTLRLRPNTLRAFARAHDPAARSADSSRLKPEDDPGRIPGRSCSRSTSQEARSAPIPAASDSKV